jgi:hypothetical protein
VAVGGGVVGSWELGGDKLQDSFGKRGSEERGDIGTGWDVEWV